MNQSSIHQHFAYSKVTAKRYHKAIEDDMKKSVKAEINLPTSKIKALLTPISQIPALSSATLSVIDSLNLEKTCTSVDQILANIPAKEKYADLLDPLRGFPLPYQYKKLLGSLELIDNAINYLALIGQDATTQAIACYIQEKCRGVFTIEILQQILKVFEAYTVVCVKRNEKERNFIVKFPETTELVMGQLAKEVIYKRKQELHSKLLKITAEKHEEFLQKSQLAKGKLSWHPDFNLQELPAIELSELPSTECEVKSISKSEITARNALIHSVFAEMQEPPQKISPLHSSPDPEPIPENPSKKRLISLCESLKSLFSSMKTPSIFFINLVKKLSQFEDTLKCDLNTLCNIFPQWLSMIPTNSGTVLRMNRQVPLTLKMIIDEFNNNLHSF